MAERNVGALLVLDGEHIAGIFSERDYARKIILLGKTSQNTPVKEIMTREVACVAPAQSIDECMAVMSKKRIRHLPVLDEGTLAGIISIGDVVQSIINRQEHHIEQLENYITSR
jgi:CBS domain-containing protein